MIARKFDSLVLAQVPPVIRRNNHFIELCDAGKVHRGETRGEKHIQENMESVGQVFHCLDYLQYVQYPMHDSKLLLRVVLYVESSDTSLPRCRAPSRAIHLLVGFSLRGLVVTTAPCAGDLSQEHVLESAVS